MALMLVSSGDGAALAIRDHLLPLVRERGALELQRDTVRLVVLRTGVWAIEHWTPFNELNSGEGSSPGYRHALERQHTTSDLLYGLDVWHARTMVLRVLWADDKPPEVSYFSRGMWETEAFLL
ncbi:hypothetical protein [Muricoccus nepalensis]|uniref:hypothetical protein n=1 Tax=Muricoccus nepalensis TaxID=1854500 RepID=UPI00112A5430|nr:hypothetical protein [Roseomonas nepalensis]